MPVGNLFFAGEHCSYDFQGYMNGAAQSGADAAKAVMAEVSGSAKAARLFSRRLQLGADCAIDESDHRRTVCV